MLDSFKFTDLMGVPTPQPVTLYAYEKEGGHIFDGAVIAARDISTGKIVAEQVADRDGKVVFSLIPGAAYRFQPSPLRENRVVGSLVRYIPSPELVITLRLTEVGPSSFGAPVDTCEEKHEAIKEIFANANYCETDADCQDIDVRSYAPRSDCFREINKNYQTNILFQRLSDYSNTCDTEPFDRRCPFQPAGRMVCVGGKGVCARVK